MTEQRARRITFPATSGYIEGVMPYVNSETGVIVMKGHTGEWDVIPPKTMRGVEHDRIVSTHPTKREAVAHASRLIIDTIRPQRAELHAEALAENEPRDTPVVEPLVWERVNAGHYVAGDQGAAGYTVRRDPNASPDNRWSLRHNAGKVSAHRLLDSAKKAAQALADAETRAAAAPLPVTVHVPAIAASHGEPYVQGTTPAGEFTEVTFPTPICPLTEPHVKHRIEGTWRDQCPGIDAPVVVAPELAGRLVAELRPQAEQQHAQADEPAPVALPTPAARPTPVEAVAAHYREAQQWPAASEVVRRGADLDELHQALGAGLVERVEYRGRAVYLLPEPNAGEPLRIDDVVTVDPLRCGRQFDVINDNTTGVDPELLQVFPRRPVDVEDTGKWVSRTYTHRVPAEVVVPYEEDDAEPAESPEVAARLDGRMVPGMSVDTGLPPVGAPREVHGPIDRTAITSRRIGSLMDSGVDPDEVLRQILPVATDQPEQVRAWMTRHDIDPQALVPGEVAIAIAADHAEALDANDPVAYRDPAVSGRWAGADDADRADLVRAAERAAHAIDQHARDLGVSPADAEADLRRRIAMCREE